MFLINYEHPSREENTTRILNEIKELLADKGVKENG
jgi:hypothetical protein